MAGYKSKEYKDQWLNNDNTKINDLKLNTMLMKIH